MTSKVMSSITLTQKTIPLRDSNLQLEETVAAVYQKTRRQPNDFNASIPDVTSPTFEDGLMKEDSSDDSLNVECSSPRVLRFSPPIILDGGRKGSKLDKPFESLEEEYDRKINNIIDPLTVASSLGRGQRSEKLNQASESFSSGRNEGNSVKDPLSIRPCLDNPSHTPVSCCVIS